MRPPGHGHKPLLLALLAGGLCGATHAQPPSDDAAAARPSPACGDGFQTLADASRLATKFTLVREACMPAGRAAAPVPAARAAGQLYLYDEPLMAAPPPAEPPRATATPPARSPAPATAPRRSGSPSAGRAVALAPVIDAAARRHDIDPLLLHAIAHVESRHDVQAVSHAGARGVLQLMPTTASRFGVGQARELHDAPTNVEAGAAYLKVLQARFGNLLPLVLAAYNAGEGAVEKHGRRIPPYRETQDYVRKVMAEYERLRGALLASGGASRATTTRMQETR